MGACQRTAIFPLDNLIQILAMVAKQQSMEKYKPHNRLAPSLIKHTGH